ncbi:T6SS effector BTH_I2691 family protein [Serratia sp. DD3]|uniref:T6SS effector BTH_I2691 family protein n=1 Tax=Serratia sp. DD3 TaxID=1410619 RepID=UPI0004D8A26E|nr:T6SS effector BTH_I2691 family protein [Serratia sp. DD3]KEY58777.1 hypothetical protein SRDD_23050 [Serratia sp. DD3]
MSTQKGCKFCIRHGLPILPLRPAVVSAVDTLPHLPGHIKVPVAAQGETAWTARLLRQGFLYIWVESGKRWINYFVTAEGYYYPLPENGDAPADIVGGKVRPCADQPEELATASLVTLPVKPLGMKNGKFWFVWSEVAWTAVVRKQHEEESYRSKAMQCFDMDAWLTAGNADQVIALDKLEDTVAEYSIKAASSQAKEWSAAHWKRVLPVAGLNLQLAANKLYRSKGAMILLQDAPAVLQDLSSLINYELQLNVYQRPEYQRELALLSAIKGLKTSLINQFERDYISDSMFMESEMFFPKNKIAAAGISPKNAMSGVTRPNSVAEQVFQSGHVDYEKYTEMVDAKSDMKSVVERKWAEYEQYYDPAKVDAFQQKFDAILNSYNDRVIVPRVKMYIACMQGQFLLGYFQHNFDPNDLGSGIDYVQTLNYCIVGMQDKIGATRYFQSLIIGDTTDPVNIMARAMVLNQDKLAKKLNEGVKGSVELLTIPWSGLADAFQETIKRMRDQSAGVMGIWLGVIAGPLVAKLQSTLESGQVFHAVVAMGAFTNKAIVTLEKTGTYKQFVAEVVGQLAKESDLTGRVNADRLRHYVQKELRRLRIDGLPMEGQETKRFLVMIDIEKVEELKTLPAKERSIALSKLLRTTGEVEAEQFTRWQGAVQRGMKQAGQAMPFTLGVVSGILQTVAIVKTANYEKTKLTPDQTEAAARYWAGVFALASTSLAIIEIGIKEFNLFSNSSSKLSVLSSNKFLSWIGRWGKRFGVGAGVITVLLDSYHTYDEVQNKHYGLAIAYGASALSGAWLTVAIAVEIPVVGTVIAAVILIGTAIFLAINEQDNIQKWLGRCLWRRIPVKASLSEEEEVDYIKKLEAKLPIWPRNMEMSELKLALEEG